MSLCVHIHVALCVYTYIYIYVCQRVYIHTYVCVCFPSNPACCCARGHRQKIRAIFGMQGLCPVRDLVSQPKRSFSAFVVGTDSSRRFDKGPLLELVTK